MSQVPAFNIRGVAAIYKFEMHRFMRTLWTGLAVPVITTSLYFVAIGSASRSRMSGFSGIEYGSCIVRGLMMLALCAGGIVKAAFGTEIPRFTGAIYELR